MLRWTRRRVRRRVRLLTPATLVGDAGVARRRRAASAGAAITPATIATEVVSIDFKNLRRCMSLLLGSKIPGRIRFQWRLVAGQS